VKNKIETILITGACGFIGSYLTKRLLMEKYKVIAFDNVSAFNPAVHRTISNEDLKNNVEFVIGNIENAALIEDSAKRADYVFHLAARSFIPDSWKNPADFYSTNILGTANVLEACRINNCGLTHISSYLYGSPNYLPIDESHPIQSYNPYSHSKVLAEEICDFYRNNYGLKISVFRPFNVYGPGQNEVFLVPEIISQLMSDKKEKITVNELSPKRDYLYVEDLVDALLFSISGKNDIYNLGNGYSVSVEDLIKTIVKASGKNKEYTSRNIKRENEVYDVVAGISKAKNLLNWSPRTSLEEGIKNCIYYYKGLYK
jgi:nucleoside-diphosphate-sugar epimerase